MSDAARIVTEAHKQLRELAGRLHEVAMRPDVSQAEAYLLRDVATRLDASCQPLNAAEVGLWHRAQGGP